ncbi:MAG: RHS repeat-associated core domain-containing protein [Gallionella sp.]|nr:RHS repeat-associated core domain-containing protein [Gallionella sp.]
MVSRQNAFVYDEGASGRCHDKETGSFYNYFRDYDPTVGRYDQFDPIGLAGGINGYIYVENNPLSFIDPTGLDITISFNESAAAGAGHVGIGVNSPNTVGQRPQAGQNPVAIAVGKNVPGQISPDPAPDARIVIPTTPRQDQQAQQCIDARTREQQNYNLYQNNCAQFVGQCLNAAGVPMPNTRYPRTLFNDIQSRFGGSR